MVAPPLSRYAFIVNIEVKLVEALGKYNKYNCYSNLVIEFNDSERR